MNTKKEIEETVKDNWKIRTTSNWRQEFPYESYEVRTHEVIYIPENKVVKTFHCSIHYTSVGEYDTGIFAVSFSEDSSQIITSDGYSKANDMIYDLKDLLQRME